ncbi:hypothetical protein P4S72_10035 [Vibrio sp. PP-XX7]
MGFEAASHHAEHTVLELNPHIFQQLQRINKHYLHQTLTCYTQQNSAGLFSASSAGKHV